MPLPISLQGDTWTRITARNSFPLLVWCAQHGRTISYGFLDRELIRRGLGHHVFLTQYGRPAGAIGDALIETGHDIEHIIPPINALIVRRDTRLPGHGIDWYLERYVQGNDRRINLTPANYRAIAEQIQEDVFNYQDWDEILELYGMQPVEGEIPIEIAEEVGNFIPPTRGWSNEGESEQHRALKNYVLNHPQRIFGQRRGWQGAVEFSLPSSDCVDVFFEGHGRQVAVEVKSIISNDADLSRGIFQCVKYRAVTRAWQRTLQEIPNGNSILVVQRELPRNLQDTADLLGIEVIVITQEEMR